MEKASIFLVVCFVACALAASPAPPSFQCTGQVNNHSIITSAPKLVKTVANGAKYTVPIDSLSPDLLIVHIYGTPFEMGQAYGAVLNDEINKLFPEAYAYIYSQINEYIDWLPPAIVKAIDQYGVEIALNLTYEFTKEWIPQHYIDFATGMSNSTGLPWDDIIRLAMFPELIKASCSMFGAWDAASGDNGLVQLRALDWDTDGPFQQFPVLTVYHPNEGDGHAFASLSWAGLMGSITGVSEVGIGVSEKVWLHYKGIENVFGIPFSFLLQDIMQYDNCTDDVFGRIATGPRTCSIFIGVGDASNNEFHVVEYGYQEVHFYNDKNFPAYPNHDLFEDLVFVNKHTQPSDDPCMNGLLHQYYGHINAENTLRYITSQMQSGDMHIAIYQFQSPRKLYVANATPQLPNNQTIMAYDRPFVELMLDDLFSMPRP